jgi:hypothetical protein
MPFLLFAPNGNKKNAHNLFYLLSLYRITD